MSSLQRQIPSPCPSQLECAKTLRPDHKPIAAANMLKINALLNPSSSDLNVKQEVNHSPPLTPAYTQASSASSTPIPQTPVTPSPKRPKLVKDAAIFVRGTPKQPVNFAAFECTETSVCLSTHQQEELAKQHDRFRIFPNGRGDSGLIMDYQRHIPYSSEKKSFYGKTSRDAFEGMFSIPCFTLEQPLMTLPVFQYTFRMPEEPAKEYLVMWDYQVGLVRITPFFKALKYSKVCPPDSSSIAVSLTVITDYASQIAQRESRAQRALSLNHRWCACRSRLLDAVLLRAGHLFDLLLPHPLGLDANLRPQLHQGLPAAGTPKLLSLQDQQRSHSMCSARSGGSALWCK